MTKEELEKKVIALLKQGKAIEAVRLVQATLQRGLNNSKDFVDAIRDKMR